MTTTPLVSVLTIFLNAERFLAEAIESVFDQTFARWELLLIDDGSSDGSTSVAMEWADRHPDRIRYLEHPGHANRGMSASRNLGLNAARGRYVAFLDADDVWLPDKLKQQVYIMAAHPGIAMVYGRTEIWESWTGRDADLLRDHTLDLGVAPDRVIDPPVLLTLLLENKVQTPTTCSALVTMEACKRLGGFEDSFRGMFEDQVFFAKLCLEDRVYVSGSCWSRYRQHPASCCATAERAGSDHLSRLPFLRWFERYLAERSTRNPAIRRSLRKELQPYTCPRLHRASKRARTMLRRLCVNRFASVSGPRSRRRA